MCSRSFLYPQSILLAIIISFQIINANRFCCYHQFMIMRSCHSITNALSYFPLLSSFSLSPFSFSKQCYHKCNSRLCLYKTNKLLFKPHDHLRRKAVSSLSKDWRLNRLFGSTHLHQSLQCSLIGPVMQASIPFMLVIFRIILTICANWLTLCDLITKLI